MFKLNLTYASFTKKKYINKKIKYKDDIYGTCGEDSFIIKNFENNKFFGVFDGISSVKDYGIDPSEFPFHLVYNLNQQLTDDTVDIKQEFITIGKKITDENIKGSTTICLSKFNQNDGKLETFNLGDSGFMVFRFNKASVPFLLYKSEPQCFRFNFPYQFNNFIESHKDNIQSIQKHELFLQKGDIIIQASDGLWDNLYENEIKMSILLSFTKGQKIDIKELAYDLLADIKELFDDDYNPTVRKGPFAAEAAELNLRHYHHSKQDDVTIIIGVVE